MGSAPGTGQLNLNIAFNVSGDTKATVNSVADVYIADFSFPVILANGTLSFLNVPVKKYVGTSVTTTFVYGPANTNHSGGSGQ
jgi:hypothetical protein